MTCCQVSIKGCRHPIVELQDNCSYIPNDVQLTDQSLLHIITGPNMGGKSTYLRRSDSPIFEMTVENDLQLCSIGCAVLMAQCGSFVAADSVEMSVMDSVMVR